MNGAGAKNCVFCQIIAGESPARWVRNDESSDFVVFHNRLKWASVMLLVVPKAHMTQEELWESDLLADAGRLGIEVGDEFCPDGFRMLSNFGPWAHQSQEHAHLHVVSGLARNLVQVESSGDPVVEGGLKFEPYEVDRTPSAMRIVPEGVQSQRELWSSTGISDSARAAMKIGREQSVGGFRLKSNFPAEDDDEPGLFLLLGGQLDLYI